MLPMLKQIDFKRRADDSQKSIHEKLIANMIAIEISLLVKHLGICIMEKLKIVQWDLLNIDFHVICVALRTTYNCS